MGRREHMTYKAYRGVMRGGTVVFLEQTSPLPEGTEVLITPVTAKAGSPAGVLAVLEASPQVPSVWVDELDKSLLRVGARRRAMIP
jgi:hypothetical protein